MGWEGEPQVGVQEGRGPQRGVQEVGARERRGAAGSWGVYGVPLGDPEIGGVWKRQVSFCMLWS